VETKEQAMEWHHSLCPWKEKFKVSVSRQDHVHCLVDCEGLILVDAVPRGERVYPDAYVRTLTKIRKRFKGDRLTRIQQISCFSMTTQGLTQDYGSHNKIWLESDIPSTLQPRYSILIFPYIWRSEGWNPRWEVWD